VLSHSVTARTREIGIRLALGAPRGQVVGIVVTQAGLLAVAGLMIGLLLAAAAGRFIRGQLYGVSPIDAITYASVAGTLSVVALVASWLPARRAASVDPITALRSE
jgi:ABC-type antimicrobial peptide transport system permease subunit